MKNLRIKQLPPKVTPEQVEVLRALVRRNRDGSLLDVEQLIQILKLSISRGSMISRLRHLAAHGLVDDGPKEIRRQRSRRTYLVTQAGINLIRPNKNLLTTDS